MLFDKWVINKYGERQLPKVAKFLNVPLKTVRSWFYYERFPRLLSQQSIVSKTGGEVSIDKWRTEFLLKQAEKGAVT